MLSMKLIRASRSGVGKGVRPFRSYLECSQAYLRGLRIHELLSNEGLSNVVLSKTLLSKAFYLYTTLGQTDLYLVSRGDTSLAWHPRHRSVLVTCSLTNQARPFYIRWLKLESYDNKMKIMSYGSWLFSTLSLIFMVST